MIGKLRRKFVIFAMISIMIVTIFIFGLIAIDMKIRSNTELDNILFYIAQNDGEMPEYKEENKGQYSYLITPESRYSTRYFTAILDEENNILSTNVEHISSIDVEQAENMAQKVGQSSDMKGFYNQYRYLIVNKDTSRMIIFIDAHFQIRSYNDFIYKSLMIIGFGLTITLVIATIFSRRAAGPIIESIEKQKQFITNAGHDLKTPVAIILANTEVLEMKLGEDDEWLKSIKNQTKRLDVLIKNLLNLARVEENNKKKSQPTEFFIDEVLEDEINSMKVLAKDKIITFSKTIEKYKIIKDKTAISQLITILLDNAIKYAPDSGTIDVRLDKYGKNNIKLKISNPYVGNKNILPDKLFDRFYRGDKSRKTNGYGIGLSMAKSIVEANKGKIICNIDSNDKINFIVIL